MKIRTPHGRPEAIRATHTTMPEPDSSSPRRRLAARLARLLIVPLVATGSLVTFTAVSAHAATGYGPYSVIGSGANGLNERSGPSSSSALVGHLANGASVYIACQIAGVAYSTLGGSPSSDTIWDQLTSGAYVADYWMSTPAVGTYSPGIPHPCGGTPPSLGNKGLTVGDNPFPAGQCTWGADNLVHNLMASDPSQYPSGHNYIDIWGNADQWASSAKSNDWTVTSTPRVDSVVVFQPGVQGADSTYGHVALVTAVNSNGTFQIEEMNGPAGPGRYDYRTVAHTTGESFILIPPFS